MNPRELFGGKMTPPAQITSSIISLIIISFLFAAQWMPSVPEKIIWSAFGWLGFHIINHLYVGISELREKQAVIIKKKK